MNVANHYHTRIVSMMTVLKANNVDVDCITVFKNVAIGYTMRHLIIDSCTDRLREVHKIDGTRVCIISDNILMYNFIDVVKTHAFLCSLHRVF